MDSHLFVRDGRFFIPTGWTRGPWTDTAMHGGPPGMLLAHAIDAQRDDAELFVSRLTIDLFRPVPLQPLEVRTAVVREGRRIKLVDAFLLCDGAQIARASGLMLRRTPGAPGETLVAGGGAVPPWSAVPPRNLTDAPRDGVERFHAAVGFRRIDPRPADAPMAAWMHLPLTLLPDTPLTPLERVTGLADFASSLGGLSRSVLTPFINADVNLSLHRLPEGEWIHLAGAGRGDAEGIATSSVHLHDQRGLFGHAFVNGMLAPAPPLQGKA